jgi:hypothetical protein
MSEAWFALAGILIGVGGSVLIDSLRSRRDDRRVSRESLRLAASEFMARVALARRISLERSHRRLNHASTTPDAGPNVALAFAEARAEYERFSLIAESIESLEAARYVLHYALWMSYAAEGRRTGIHEASVELLSWSLKFRVAVRKELGLRKPGNVYRDPMGGLPEPGDHVDP